MKIFNILAMVGIAIIIFELGWEEGCRERIEKSTVKIMIQTAYTAGEIDQMEEELGNKRIYKNREEYSDKEILVN